MEEVIGWHTHQAWCGASMGTLTYGGGYECIEDYLHTKTLKGLVEHSMEFREYGVKSLELTENDIQY
jgi:hypothetical protein